MLPPQRGQTLPGRGAAEVGRRGIDSLDLLPSEHDRFRVNDAALNEERIMATKQECYKKFRTKKSAQCF